jgi:arylsulfatase A-like enzyme
MPPNIFIIMTDQQYGGAMSCAGNPELDTPAMDRLAEAGVRFDQTYCTYPLCIPARESLLTGRMPFELGYREWGDPIDPRFHDQELGVLFREAGYDTAYAGKLHAPRNDAARHGFRQLCGHDDAHLVEACTDYLQNTRQEPFLLVASFDNPHNICEWARHQNLPWGNIPPAATAECPTLPANFGIPPFEPQVIRWIQQRAPRVYPTVGNTPEQWRHYRHAYYRLIEKVDAQIGAVLDVLHGQGLAENTLVLFTSDHGDGHGAHQWNQKSILYEEPTRVPLIASWPGQIRQGVADDTHLVSAGLDILPTLCDYAGLTPPSDLPGASLRPLLEGTPAPDWREHLVVEAWPFQGDPGRTLGRMVRTNRYKYVVYSWGRYREQLFDLENDPGEMVNLAVSRRYGDELERHRQLLRDYCARTGDEFGPHIPYGFGLGI